MTHTLLASGLALCLFAATVTALVLLALAAPDAEMRVRAERLLCIIFRSET